MFSSPRNLALPSATPLVRRPMPITPLPVGRIEIAHRRKREIALGRRGDDGCRQRMLAAALDAGGEPQHFVFVEARRGHDGHDLRLAFGQRAGLVDDERVDLLHALQRLGILDQHAGLRAAADADHDRHRRRQAERAGAGDDQHADGGDQADRRSAVRGRTSPRPQRRAARPRSPPARTRRRPDRRGAGSARGCAARSRPSARSATASCRGRLSRRASRSCRSVLIVPPITLRQSSPWSPAWIRRSPSIHRPTSGLRARSPSTGTFSPGRTRSRSPTCDLIERHFLVGAVVASRAAPSSAQDRAARGSRPRSARARAAPAPGRAAPAR